MLGRVNSIETFACDDGWDVRFAVFLQGCGAKCIYCANVLTWDFNGGELMDSDDIIEQMVSLKAGAYKLATKSEAIIQPAAIIGSSKLAKRKPWQWFKIIVRFLPAIYPADYAGLTTHEIGYKVIDMVNKEFPHEKKFQIEESNEL